MNRRRDVRIGRREARLERISRIFQEYRTALVATDLLDEKLRSDPGYLATFGLRSRMALALRENLEATYLVRIYSEFEAGLRDAWENAWRRDTEPPMRALLDAIAARRYVPREWLERVHRVRNYRNHLVHEGGIEHEQVAIAESRDHLCAFLSKLPSDW